MSVGMASNRESNGNEKKKTYSDWMKKLFTETATIGNGTKRIKMRFLIHSLKRGSSFILSQNKQIW
jgi:hypothetical protein